MSYITLVSEWTLVYYRTANGRSPVQEYLDKLDAKGAVGVWPESGGAACTQYQEQALGATNSRAHSAQGIVFCHIRRAAGLTACLYQEDGQDAAGRDCDRRAPNEGLSEKDGK